MSMARGNQSMLRSDRTVVRADPDSIHRSSGPHVALGALVCALLVVAAACGSSSDGETSEAGERGRRVANSNGCASCHGNDGQGGVGPKWIDLAGSDVELADGRVVVADDEYLRRAIVDPSAEIVAGFALQMPENGLSDAEVADVIAYIRELGSNGGDGG